MFGLWRYSRNSAQSLNITKVIYRRFMKVPDNVEAMLKRTDLVPKNYHLVYRETSYTGAGVMYHSLNLFTCFMAATTGYMWYHKDGLFNPDDEDPMIARPWHGAVLVMSIAGFYTVAWITRKRYPIRIYYSEKDRMYRAIFVGKVPYTVETYSFPEHSLTYDAKDSLLFWKTSLFRHENCRKILLFEGKFRTPNDFHQMLKPHELDR